MPTQTALVIVFDGVEEVEALTAVDILRRADIEVTVASVTGSATVTGRNKITFAADTGLSLVESEAYDLVVLPGGPGVQDLVANSRLGELLTRQYTAKRELAAICAAPKVLASNGLLNRHTATSHASVRGDLPNASDEPIVEDANIVTSQGVGTAIAFSLALVRRLKGETKAKEIAESIHY